MRGWTARRRGLASWLHAVRLPPANGGDSDAELAQSMRLPGLLPGPADLIRIENLGLLKGLRKLCLDNNMIAKIEGLESLTGLTWLDLSFNKIAKIEGLDKLTALTDLSLFNNEIKVIEGLDANVNLQCLSLGNNLIEAVDQASGGR